MDMAEKETLHQLTDKANSQATNSHWYAVHSKPRQEHRALANLAQQGYDCYLPLRRTEKIDKRGLAIVQAPLFPRYLFIFLDSGPAGPGWGPIRSTLGVSRIVSFGNIPAKLPTALVEALREQSVYTVQQVERLFAAGETVKIADGAFAGLTGMYQMPSGEQRAMVLIDILSKLCRVEFPAASLRKAL